MTSWATGKIDEEMRAYLQVIHDEVQAMIAELETATS